MYCMYVFNKKHYLKLNGNESKLITKYFQIISYLLEPLAS